MTLTSKNTKPQGKKYTVSLAKGATVRHMVVYAATPDEARESVGESWQGTGYEVTSCEECR